jgi:hypothetical protein
MSEVPLGEFCVVVRDVDTWTDTIRAFEPNHLLYDHPDPDGAGPCGEAVHYTVIVVRDGQVVDVDLGYHSLDEIRRVFQGVPLVCQEAEVQ